MSSRFSGGYPESFNVNGSGRSMPLLPRSDLIGKRSLVEFQQQHQLQQQPSVYLRNVKPRVYNQYHSPDLLVSNFSLPLPGLQQLRQEGLVNNDQINKFNGGKGSQLPVNLEMETKMLNRLRELEKELLLDDEEGENDAVSVVTDTDWSESVQRILNPVPAKKQANMIAVSPSPTTSSSSSSASSSATVSPKLLVSDAAEAITDGKPETARELITRLNRFSSARGNSEQRLGFYIASALRARLRVNFTAEDSFKPSSAAELYTKEHMLSTQLLYDKSPCFKLAFMAANQVILQTLSDSNPPESSGIINRNGNKNRNGNIHVVDFDIGHGLQYVYLIHEIASNVDRGTPTSLTLTTFKDFGNGGVERLKLIGDGLKALSNKFGVSFNYNVLEFKLCEISKQGLAIDNNDVLAVNFAFKLSKLPDESVTTENLRDEVLRRVKGLSPAVVTVLEQELNTNTASFTGRVNDVFSYYTTLLDSFDATSPRDNPERVKIEDGLSRRIVNSVACEGRDRVERCEVFGKWRARLRMAGFEQNPVSRVTVESLSLKVNSGTRGNPGFSVGNESGEISFGWLGRTLTTVSAWC